MIKVIVKKPRPDFRVFIDLLYGFGHNVDSDGDSIPVYSREWRELYLKDRENNVPSVELYSKSVDILQFEIVSKSKRLEELAALYLYLYCGEFIERNGTVISQKAIESLKANYSKELKRANESVWHQSNENNPYPNIA